MNLVTPISIRHVALLAIAAHLSTAACGSTPPASSPDAASREEASSSASTDTPSANESAPEASEGAADLTEEERRMKSEIQRFLQDPVKGETYKGDFLELVRWANASKRVQIVLRQSILDGLPEGNLSKAMLAAFIIGNAGAQLESGKRGDAPAAGVRAMIIVYRALLQENPKLRNAKLDDFGARLDKGTLEAHVAELIAKEGAGG